MTDILNLNGKPNSNPSFIQKRGGQTEEVRKYIMDLLQANKVGGMKTVDLRSGDIHENLKLSARMPTVCAAMTSLQLFRYEVIQSPPKGKGSSLVLRYFFRFLNSEIKEKASYSLSLEGILKFKKSVRIWRFFRCSLL